MDAWILDEQRRPVRVPTMRWAKWMSADPDSRIVMQEDVHGYFISTVFLGIDHALVPSEGPILWETMAFNGEGKSIDQERCSGSVEQAEEMHRHMCKLVRAIFGEEATR